MHVHVYSAEGEAKFWLEPSIEHAKSHGLTEQQLAKVAKIVKEHEHELISAWQSHFGS